MRQFVSFLLYCIGMVVNRRKMRVLSIYFHNPAPEVFEKIIRWAERHHYQFIDRETFIDWIKGKRDLKQKSLFISFDDAWKGNLNLLPIIERHNVPITIFSPVEPLRSGNFWWEFVAKKIGYHNMQSYKLLPYSDFRQKVDALKNEIALERSAMTEEELQQISKHPLVDIQSHTYTHPILTRLPDDVLQEELHNSKKELEALLDKKITSFSYPNGDFSEREVEAVKKEYETAFTTEQNYPKRGGNPLRIPRIAQANDYWSNLAKITGTWKWIKKWITH